MVNHACKSSEFLRSRLSALRASEQLRLRLAAAGTALALALVSAALRFYRLGEFPPGLFFDEGIDGLLALKVLQGEHAIFFPVDQGREASAIYVSALSILLFGRTLLAMHLPTALGSVAMVLALFWLGRLLFARDENGRAVPLRGIWVGGVSAGLMAVSLSQTIIGRTAYNKTTHMPLLLCLCLGLLWTGWRERSWGRIALAGLCAGLLPYTYIPARFVPILFLLFALSFVLTSRKHSHDGDAQRQEQDSQSFSARLRAQLPQAGLFAAVAMLLTAPLLGHFALNPDHFFLRSDRLWVFDASLHPAGPLKTFLRNLWDHLAVFGLRGDPHWRHNYAAQPLLNAGEALFFWLGAAMSLRRWQQPAHRLLLLWLGVLLLPALLARDVPPNTLRMIGAAPAVYLLTGVGAWEAFRFVQDRLGRVNRNGAALAAAAMASAAALLILAQGARTWHTYFHRWAAAPELDAAFELVETELAETLSALPSAPGTVYLVPSYYKYYADRHRNYGLEFLYTGAAPLHFIHPVISALPQKVEAALTAGDNLSTVKVMEWNTGDCWIDDDPERFAFLLSKYGRYQGSETFARFQFHSYVELSLDQPWSFYEQLAPLTVEYDGGIALTGAAVGQGGEQLPLSQPLNLRRDRPLWMALQWRTAPALEIDYVVSLRLYNAGGAIALQKDDVLWDPDHWPTSSWSTDRAVDTLHLVELPPDLAPGDYELRIVVYDFETQKPTVEIGVWEAEKSLAHLRLTEAQ